MSNSYINLFVSIALQKNVILRLILVEMGMLLNLHSYHVIDHYNIEVLFFRCELGIFSL